MEMKIKDEFIRCWDKYFDGAELPITFYYTDQAGSAEMIKPAGRHRCIIAELYQVRNGKSLCYDAGSISCFGGKRYLGFAEEVTPNFEYFLSYGIPGKLEGERYKKTPEIVKKMVEQSPHFRAPGRFIVFKRWDTLVESDTPEVVIFFAEPDVLSGLFTLANFDESEQNAVLTPFGAGCSSIVQHPYLEKDSQRPRCVLGMFDVSARPCVQENILTFSAPMGKFVKMLENMEESFLITNSWDQVRKRISRK
jgi:uncharacterized protein (DUF169 family)